MEGVTGPEADTASARRVYLSEAVDAYVHEMHAQLADLQSRLAAHERGQPSWTETAAATALLAQAREIIAAHQRAEDVVADAERRAQQLLAETVQRARELQTAAEARARLTLAEAQRRAESLTGEVQLAQTMNGSADGPVGARVRSEAQRLIAEAHRLVDELFMTANGAAPATDERRAPPPLT